MAQEITLPVKLLIENLLAILKDMRSQLSTLKVDSSGYRKLEGVINGIEKKIQDIQVIASRPIMDGKQFSAVEKDISHIYDDITKLGMEAGKIKFGDLALTGDLKLKLLEFDNLLKTIKNDLKNIELSAKTAFLSSDAGKLWQELNPELATKSFLKITEIIDSEVAKLRLIINDAKAAYLDYNNTILVSKNINSFMRGKDSLADRIKAAGMFDRIFNSKGNFKSGGRNALEDWLKSEFSLSGDVIKQITQGSGQLVLAAFTEMKDSVRAALKSEQNRLSADRKNAIDTTNGGKTLTDKIANEEAKQLTLVSAQDAVIKSKEASIEAENNLRAAEEATKNARSEYIQSLTNLARAHLLMSNSCESAKALLANLNKIVDEGKNKLAKLDLASSKLSGISNFVNRYVGAYAIIRKVSTAIRNAFNNIKELDKTITSIAVVTNMSQQDLWNKVGQYTLMAQEYGVTTNDVYKVSQLFYQQGLLTNLVMSLTTETLKMAKIAGMDYTAATNAMTVAVRAFNIEMSLAQLVTDTYSALAAKFAVSSAEIANAMEKTASSAANVGMSLLSTSAFMSVMIQTTRESAQNIGSALKSIISRYGEMKASPDSLINVDGEVAAFNKVDTALLSIGISIKDSAGQFRNFDDVIMELAAKWDTLDNNTQRYVATVMAGNRQQSRFIALVSNYGELSRAMDVANNAENASIVQVAKTMDSLESKTNQLKNAFSQLYLDLHIESGLKNAYDWITRIITTLGKLGTLNGVLPTLANLFGFGTGLKSTVKAILNSIEAKKLKIETDNSQYEKEIEKVKNDLSLPYELKITANVDDSLLLAAKNEIMLMNNPTMAAAASSAAGKFALLGNIAGADNNARLATLMGALNFGKLSTEASRKEFLTKDMHVDEKSPIFNDLMLALEKLANSANLASGSLDTLDKKTDGTSKGVDNLGKTSDTTGALTLKTGQDMSKAGSDALDAGNKFKNAGDRANESGRDWKSGITKGAMIFSTVSRLLGTAITALGAAHEDKSTDSIEVSKLYTGIGNGLSMAGTGAQLGMMTSQWWGPIAGALAGFLVGGVGAIIDGLHMSLEERLALAKAEAKKAADESLKAQAKTIDLSNLINNVKQLLKAMYNSTEDMLAYKDAMNTMIDQYPLLISNYDEAGNAIIDLNNAEKTLALIRLEGALAARIAAIEEGNVRTLEHQALEEALEAVKNVEGSNSERSGGLSSGTITNQHGFKIQIGENRYREFEGSSTDLVSTESGIFKYTTDYIQAFKTAAPEVLGKTVEDVTTLTYDEIIALVSSLKENPELGGNAYKYFDNDWRPISTEAWKEYENKYLSSESNGFLYINLTALDNIIEEYSDLFNGKTHARQLIGIDDKSIPITLDQLNEITKKINSVIDSNNTALETIKSQSNYALSQESLFTATDNGILSTTDITNIESKNIYSRLFNKILQNYIDKNTEYTDALEWYNTKDLELEFLTAALTLANSFITWYNSLINSQRLILESIDFTEYINVDLLINDIGLQENLITPEIYQALIDLFIDSNKINRDRLLNLIWTDQGFNAEALGKIEPLDENYALMNIYDLFEADSTGASKIISKYADYFSNQLVDINNLAEQGYNELAKSRLNILDDFATGLAQLNDSLKLNDLFSTINSIDFTDFDGLVKVLKALEKYRQENNILDRDDGTAKILQSVINAQELLIFNIHTLTESITEKITNASKEVDSIINTNKSGLDLSKALELLSSLNVSKSAEEAFKFEDLFTFDATLGKYVYTIDGIKASIKLVKDNLDAEQTKLNRMKELFDTNLIYENELENYDIEDSDEAINNLKYNISNFDTLDESAKILFDSLANEFIKDTTILEHTVETWKKFLEAKKNQNDIDITKLQLIIDAESTNEVNQYFNAIDWASVMSGTDYYDTNKVLVDALAEKLELEAGYTTELVLNKYLETIEDPNLRALTAEKINSSIIQTRTSQYQTAISELLTYNTDKYLSVATQQVLSNVGTSLGDIEESADGAILAATKFLSALSKQIGQAGYTLEQYNQDANSILERVLSEQTQGKALLDFASEDNIGASQLEGLANILHILLDELVDIESGIILGDIGKYLSYNTTTGNYEIYGSFDNFTKELEKLFGIKIDRTSLEYIDAFKASNLARIKKHDIHKTDKAVSEEVNSIVSAKAGDSLDLTETWVAIEKFEKANMLSLIRKLSSLGAQFTDGILTIVDDTNIPAIISAIAVEALNAGVLIPELIAQLNDALAEVLNKITGLLKTGISGGLSNTDKLSLENWASLNGVTDLTFTKTAEGYKLAYDSAIKVYNVIKSIDALLGEVVFDELKNNLIESNEHFKTVQDLMEHIKDLLAKIADTGKYSPEKINLYKLELELSERILAVRSAAEQDASFNFMSNSIPEALNNPLNWFANMQEGYQALNASRKSGYMDYTTFYNLFTEMGHLAEQSGEIPIGAGKTLKNMLDAQDLIEQAAGTLHVNAATGKLEVSFKELAKLGIDFGKAGGEMDQSITKGMKEFAHAQVTMLDGLIKMLETIVLMEDLKNIGDGDGTLNIGEIFPNIEAGSFGLDSDVLRLISEYLDPTSGKYISWLKDVTLGGQTLEQLFSNAKNNLIKDKAEAEKFYAVLKSFHDMNVSLDWTGGEDTLAEMARYFNENGIVNQELNWNGLTVMIGEGEMIPTITNPKTGKQEYQWTTNAGQLQQGTATEYCISRKKDALKALQDNASRGKVEINKSGNSARILLLDRDPIAVKIDKDGKFEYNGKTYDTLNQIFTDYIGEGKEFNGETLTKVEELKIAAGIIVKPYITENPQLTADLIRLLRDTGAELIKKDFEANPILSLAKYGINLDKETSEADLDAWLKSLDEQVTLGANTDPIVQAVNDLKLPDKYVNVYGIYKGEKNTSDTPTINHKKNAWIKSGGEVTLASATGNANARGTLLGELGPELVVSNGHYFVAGLNGAEMVNLADDAIVFNHLQTKSLLEKGTSNGRGKAITNEKNAISYAKGNINGGPAMASASSALTALKQLKAQWKAIEKLSTKDLAAKGGGGGGGGDPKAFIKDLEKWYNWLQRIAVLEQKINYEEQLRSKYQSDMIAHGREYAQSQLDTLPYLKEQAAINKSLYESQLAYFDKRRAEMNDASNPFTSLYTFDEYGQLKYKDGALAKLSELSGRNSLTGQANYTAAEQYEKLVAMGYGKYMEYDSSGNKIDLKADDWQVNAVLAFWDKIDADQLEMLSLHDSVEEHKTAMLQAQLKLNEILKAIEDNLIAVEDKVLGAIVDMRERAIKLMQDERNAIEESANNLIDGLSNQLLKERDMYSKQQDANELTKLQRQLGILQRSGGSASLIASLLKEITSKQLDAYFEAQQAQIDALQEASDNELERLDRLIELEEEQLAYEKENGLLWNLVYEQMAKSPEEIATFIHLNTSSYWADSPIKSAQEYRDTLFQAQEFVLYREKVEGGLDALIAANSDLAVAEQAANVTALGEAAAEASASAAGDLSGSSSGGSSGVTGTGKYRYKRFDKQYHITEEKMSDGTWKNLGKIKHTLKDGKCTRCGQEIVGGGGGGRIGTLTNRHASFVMTYDIGGMVDETGPAYLHARESVLTPELTSILRNDILSNKPTSLLSLLTDFRDAYNSIPNASAYDTINSGSGVSIENAIVEMNVSKIANDYDAQRAGELALDKMLLIARKTQAQNRIGR